MAGRNGTSRYLDHRTKASSLKKGAAHRAQARVTGNRPGEQTNELQQKTTRQTTFRRPQLAGERLMTAKELAEFLALPERRVYYWANKGVLPHVRIGRSMRFA